MPAMSSRVFRVAATTLLALGLAPIAPPVGAAARQAAAPDEKPYFTEPAISPDRSEIAFSSGGDIWADTASRLTHVGHAAYSGSLIEAMRPG